MSKQTNEQAAQAAERGTWITWMFVIALIVATLSFGAGVKYANHLYKDLPLVIESTEERVEEISTASELLGDREANATEYSIIESYYRDPDLFQVPKETIEEFLADDILMRSEYEKIMKIHDKNKKANGKRKLLDNIEKNKSGASVGVGTAKGGYTIKFGGNASNDNRSHASAYSSNTNEGNNIAVWDPCSEFPMKAAMAKKCGIVIIPDGTKPCDLPLTRVEAEIHDCNVDLSIAPWAPAITGTCLMPSRSLTNPWRRQRVTEGCRTIMSKAVRQRIEKLQLKFLAP